MKILAISDTHGFHGLLQLPVDIDMIIVAGDLGDARIAAINHVEVTNFLWFLDSLKSVKYKVVVAGNHDTSIHQNMINWGLYPDIIYLENDSTTIEGIKIWGSPYTPSFGSGWAFNKDRGKLDAIWANIPDDTDILITHGPPLGILDLAYRGDQKLYEQCGDKALLNHVRRVNPAYHIFGHIHNNEKAINAGIKQINDCRTTFINASCVTDSKFDVGLTSNGILFEYEKS